jgi:hypothetical protein
MTMPKAGQDRRDRIRCAGHAVGIIAYTAQLGKTFFYVGEFNHR